MFLLTFARAVASVSEKAY